MRFGCSARFFFTTDDYGVAPNMLLMVNATTKSEDCHLSRLGWGCSRPVRDDIFVAPESPITKLRRSGMVAVRKDRPERGLGIWGGGCYKDSAPGGAGLDQNHLTGMISRWRHCGQKSTTANSPASSLYSDTRRNRYDPHLRHETMNCRNGLSAGVVRG